MVAAPEVWPASGLYTGLVTHLRRRPTPHLLRHRIFMLLLDLDAAPALIGGLRWLSRGRFGLMSFREADHGDHGGRPLAAQVRDHLAAAGIASDGPIRLLTMPRVLGFGFNPLSLYFCHAADGTLVATLYEVTNTFGQRHSYLAPAGGEAGVERHAADKRFFVSPFMDMALAYRFTVRPPGEAVRLVIDVEDGAGALLTAAFVARRRPLTDANLLAAWASHPFLTIGVVAAIHWQALKIWLKGVRLRPRPPAPDHLVSPARAVGGCPVHGAQHAG